METWDGALIRTQGRTSLVGIAREGRLRCDYGSGPVPVALSWVDEAALALIGLAEGHRRDIGFIYPAPAGEASVLLAAQLLLDRLVKHQPHSSVGIVTADTTRAAQTWERLSISTHGEHVRISEHFGCFRAGPDGEAPNHGLRLPGLIVGERCGEWNVDVLIKDHLAGPVDGALPVPTVELYADPLDPHIESAFAQGTLMWGWPESELSHWPQPLSLSRGTVPFSVAHQRLQTIAEGVSVTVEISRHDDAEIAIKRAREDLRVLRELAGPEPGRNVRKGLSVAWHHLGSLVSLPCKPSDFDRFAGIPPVGARATHTFAPEISAWARTLDRDLAEVASVLSSDLEDLRAALDHGHPFLQTLSKLADQGPESVAIVKTRTAAQALAFSLNGDPNRKELEVGKLSITGMSKLHRTGSCNRAIIVGAPARWDWHRLDSGLSKTVRVLVIGEEDGRVCGKASRLLRLRRDQWSGPAVRGNTWRALVGCEPPPIAQVTAAKERPIEFMEGPAYAEEDDPFDALGPLMHFEPLRVGEEGIEDNLAISGLDGTWVAEVAALRVDTEMGTILLAAGRPIDVRDGIIVTTQRPEDLIPGMRLLISRREGRLGLLEALEERLRQRRPDLIVGRLLIDDFHLRVRIKLQESGLSSPALHRKMKKLGCDKGMNAVKGWVSGASTLAPRDLTDLHYLNSALNLELSDSRLSELFAAVRRQRGFRRSAGRALARAARASSVAADYSRMDSDTGLSIADLREAVIEARVISVDHTSVLTPLAEIGRLEVFS